MLLVKATTITERSKIAFFPFGLQITIGGLIKPARTCVLPVFRAGTKRLPGLPFIIWDSAKVFQRTSAFLLPNGNTRIALVHSLDPPSPANPIPWDGDKGPGRNIQAIRVGLRRDSALPA